MSRCDSHLARAAAFTLIEILVVVGIFGLLTAILVPALGASRRQARDVNCASNMRQVGMALIAYADQNRAKFPVNCGTSGQFWYLESAIGRYLQGEVRVGRAGTTPPSVDPRNGMAGGVFVCPNDLRDSVRSYSMNLYASGGVSASTQKLLDGKDPPGRLFQLGGRAETGRLMLLLESWPELPVQTAVGTRYVAQAIVGLHGKPGERFGGVNGIGWTTPPDATPGRFEKRDSQITFYRHDPVEHPIEQPKGKANFAFADGHVQMLRQDQLVIQDRNSSGIALWSPMDWEIEQGPKK
jgi:prepilin-type processing-associated H-X9-DG protein